jgi:hypothetical protein
MPRKESLLGLATLGSCKNRGTLAIDIPPGLLPIADEVIDYAARGNG